MASFSSTYPSQRPVFTLDAANAGRLDPRMTFSRADTPPTYAAPSAVHYWSNEKHLSSENLLKSSQNFDNASYWNFGSNQSNTVGATAPDGSSTAITLSENSATDYRLYDQALSLGADTYTLTVYAKRGSGTRYLYVRLYSAFQNWSNLVFDLAGGAVTTANGGATSFSGVSGTQVLVGSYYKITATFTAVALNGLFFGMTTSSPVFSTSYGVDSYAGDGSSSIVLWGPQLNTTGATVYDSPTTTQISRSYAPSLKSVATAGQPRFEYDPSSDGQSMGILIEGQFQQLAQYTEDLSNAYWTKANTTVESNAAVAPDGTLTADLVVETTATGVGHHVRTDNVTGISSSTTYTATVYAKAAGLGFCRLYTNIGAANTGAVFNLSDGTHNVTDGSGTFSSSSVGNGWYRLQMTFTTSNTNNGAVYFHTATDSSTVIYAGNGYGSVILWGANLTQSSHSYSYLKAEGAATTKAAESLSVDAADIGYTGGPVSMQADFKVNSVLGSTRRIASIENTRGLIRPYISGGGDVKTFGDTDGATVIDTSIQTDITANTDYSMALRWDTNDYRGALNGTLGNADTSCPLPDFDGASFYVGGQSSSGYELNGHIKRVALYNEALSDTNLQALTS